MSHLKFSLSLLALASALLLTTGCDDETTCGPGTILEAGECVPLQAANCAGEGVRFINGFCVPDFSDVCGDGTEPNEDGSACVAVETDTPDAGSTDTGNEDAGNEDTGNEDTGNEDTGDAVADEEGDSDDAGEGDGDAAEGDVEPDEEVAEGFDPECAGDLVADERICLWGQALNAVTFAPLPHDADPALQVQTKDRSATLQVFALGETVASLAEANIVEGGYFSMRGFDLDETDEDHQFLVIVGEDEDTEPPTPEGVGTNWMRTVSENITPNGTETEYEKTLLLVPMASVNTWSGTDEFSGGSPLQATGFSLQRVVDCAQQPVTGASLVCSGGDDCDEIAFHYLNNTVDDFSGTSTGATGLVVVTGGGLNASCGAEGKLYRSPCPAFPGRATVGLIITGDCVGDD